MWRKPRYSEDEVRSVPKRLFRHRAKMAKPRAMDGRSRSDAASSQCREKAGRKKVGREEILTSSLALT